MRKFRPWRSLYCLFLGCFCFLTVSALGQPHYDLPATVTTLPSDETPGSAIAVDGGGTVYFVSGHAIFMWDKVLGPLLFAGSRDKSGFVNGAWDIARFNNPLGLAFDCEGNLLVADTGNNAIRGVTPGGRVFTVANSSGFEGHADAPAPDASFNRPTRLAVWCPGDVIYVADTGNNCIRKIAGGQVTTLAGGGASGEQPGYKEGQGTAALFHAPVGLAVDCTSNLVFVADFGNDAVRQITFDGKVTTVAGRPTISGSEDGSAAVATLAGPTGLAWDSGHRVLYVAEIGNGTIRSVTFTGSGGQTQVRVGTVAGKTGPSQSVDGPGAKARFTNPVNVAADAAGNLYVPDLSDVIGPFPSTLRKVVLYQTSDPQSQNISLGYPFNASVAVTGAFPGMSFTFQWFHDGLPIPGAISSSLRISNAQPADAGTYRVEVDMTQGSSLPLDMLNSGEADLNVGPAWFFGDTLGNPCCPLKLSSPQDVSARAGALYVADTSANRIRSVTFDGTNWVALTLAGGGPFGTAAGYADGPGSTALFYYPEGLAADPSNNTYVADTQNHLIRMMTLLDSNWVVTTIAGFYQTDSRGFPVGGYADGTGTNALFNQPMRIALDNTGNIYVADFGNSLIRKITSDGSNWLVTTLAGKAGQFGYADATGTNAIFNQPTGLVVDNRGILYVADANNDLIRMVTPGGVATTIAGLARHAGFTDGLGGAARFAYPTGIARDCAGNLYVADTIYSLIRQLTPIGSNWMVTTIGGSGGGGFDNGTGKAASFWAPQGIAADCEGNIFVADTGNSRLRLGRAVADNPVILSQPQGQTLIAGMDGALSVTVSNPGPMNYQWLFNGAALANQTNSVLPLGTLSRSNAGLYSVVVVGTNGGLVSSTAQVRVLVPPVLQPPQSLGTNGGFSLLLRDADGGLPHDPDRVVLQWRTNLPSGTDTNWQTLVPLISLTNGFLELRDTNAVEATRFYRVMEY